MQLEDISLGLKVKVISFDGYNNRPEHWSEEGEMDEWRGVVVTISDFDSDYVYLEEDGGEWSWSSSDFEPFYNLSDDNPNTLYRKHKMSEQMGRLNAIIKKVEKIDAKDKGKDIELFGHKWGE